MTQPLKRPPAFVRALPRRLVSRFMGQVGRLQAPSFLLQPILRVYCKAFGVDEAEMVRPLASYTSFLDFFTRPLKAGVRPLPEDPHAIVSPADGTVQNAGNVEAGTILQVKGLPYRVSDLLGSERDAAPFEGGTFLTAYLSPGDYHRYHWCFDGTVHTVRHLPGDLWPVNEGAVYGVPGLFARNERVAVLGRTTSGHAFAYVPVGALNVGSIRLTFHDVRTNRGRAAQPRTWDVPDHVATRGAECGCFEFGSSIVLLLERGAGAFDALEPGARLRVGQAVGKLAP
ncbi:MAG: archaetidylserine decarboxylase [Planctomycetota bacterium]|nr:archaetidylserine decarboxylase [Planctomycetota bacterium]